MQLSARQFSSLFQIVKEFTDLELALNRAAPKLDRRKLVTDLRVVQRQLDALPIDELPSIERRSEAAAYGVQIVTEEGGRTCVVLNGTSEFFDAMRLEIEDAIRVLGPFETFLRTGNTPEAYSVLLLELARLGGKGAREGPE